MTQRVPVISPELVLVDPALAEIARAELPDPGQFLAARLAAAPEAEPSVYVQTLDEPEPAPAPQADARPQRRRSKALRAVLVGSLLLLAGFAAGRMTATPPPGFTIEQVLQEASPARTSASGAVAPTKTSATTGNPAPRPHAKSRRAGRGVAGVPHGRGVDGASKRRGPHAKATGRVKKPSRNVLGVIVSLSPETVTIRWHPPASSRQVMVLRRKRGAHTPKLIYRGRRTWLRDGSLQPGTYTYVIVNYDRGRRASSGVPTVVDVSGTDL